MNPVRNDSETMSCQVCGTAFRRSGRRRHCSNACRQAAWRRRSRAPILPVVAKPDTVSQRPNCEARFLGKQRCQDCNTWARRLGPGGQCPCCDEPISVTELLQPDQFTARQGQKTTRGGDKEQRMKGAAAPDPQVLTISPTSAIQSGELSGVSCPSATAYTATGYYQNSSLAQVTLAEYWNGTSWAIQSSPKPRYEQRSE